MEQPRVVGLIEEPKVGIIVTADSNWDWPAFSALVGSVKRAGSPRYCCGDALHSDIEVKGLVFFSVFLFLSYEYSRFIASWHSNPFKFSVIRESNLSGFYSLFKRAHSYHSYINFDNFHKNFGWER